MSVEGNLFRGPNSMTHGACISRHCSIQIGVQRLVLQKGRSLWKKGSARGFGVQLAFVLGIRLAKKVSRSLYTPTGMPTWHAPFSTRCCAFWTIVPSVDPFVVGVKGNQRKQAVFCGVSPFCFEFAFSVVLKGSQQDNHGFLGFPHCGWTKSIRNTLNPWETIVNKSAAFFFGGGLIRNKGGFFGAGVDFAVFHPQYWGRLRIHVTFYQ